MIISTVRVPVRSYVKANTTKKHFCSSGYLAYNFVLLRHLKHDPLLPFGFCPLLSRSSLPCYGAYPTALSSLGKEKGGEGVASLSYGPSFSRPLLTSALPPSFGGGQLKLGPKERGGTRRIKKEWGKVNNIRGKQASLFVPYPPPFSYGGGGVRGEATKAGVSYEDNGLMKDVRKVEQVKNRKTLTASKQKFYTSYSKLSEVKLLTIGIASPLRILQWAEKTLPNGKKYGEVLNANTLHHKTFKPQKGGLFCQRIFGPLKDFQCDCGTIDKSSKQSQTFFQETVGGQQQLSSASHRASRNPLQSPIVLPNSLLSSPPSFGFDLPAVGKTGGGEEKDSRREGDVKNTQENKLGETQSRLPSARKEGLLQEGSFFVRNNPKDEKFGRKFCSRCDVEFTWSVIRRYQLGYIKLCSPVTHIWFLKGTPSYLALLLDMKKRYLQFITYCSEILTIEKSSLPIYSMVNNPVGFSIASPKSIKSSMGNSLTGSKGTELDEKISLPSFGSSFSSPPPLEGGESLPFAEGKGRLISGSSFSSPPPKEGGEGGKEGVFLRGKTNLPEPKKGWYLNRRGFAKGREAIHLTSSPKEGGEGVRGGLLQSSFFSISKQALFSGGLEKGPVSYGKLAGRALMAGTTEEEKQQNMKLNVVGLNSSFKNLTHLKNLSKKVSIDLYTLFLLERMLYKSSLTLAIQKTWQYLHKQAFLKSIHQAKRVLASVKLGLGGEATLSDCRPSSVPAFDQENNEGGGDNGSLQRNLVVGKRRGEGAGASIAANNRSVGLLSKVAKVEKNVAYLKGAVGFESKGKAQPSEKLGLVLQKLKIQYVIHVFQLLDHVKYAMGSRREEAIPTFSWLCKEKGGGWWLRFPTVPQDTQKFLQKNSFISVTADPLVFPYGKKTNKRLKTEGEDEFDKGREKALGYLCREEKGEMEKKIANDIQFYLLKNTIVIHRVLIQLFLNSFVLDLYDKNMIEKRLLSHKRVTNIEDTKKGLDKNLIFFLTAETRLGKVGRFAKDRRKAFVNYEMRGTRDPEAVSREEKENRNMENRPVLTSVSLLVNYEKLLIVHPGENHLRLFETYLLNNGSRTKGLPVNFQDDKNNRRAFYTPLNQTYVFSALNSLKTKTVKGQRNSTREEQLEVRVNQNKFKQKENNNSKHKKTLRNNVYTLSHRERWDIEKDWQIFTLFTFGTTETLDMPIFAYQERLNSFINSTPVASSNHPILPSYSFDHLLGSSEPLYQRGGASMGREDKASKMESRDSTLPNSSFYSGAGIVQQLLNEFNFSWLIGSDKNQTKGVASFPAVPALAAPGEATPFSLQSKEQSGDFVRGREMKKLDKQNRLILYQLNKSILKLKRQIQIFVYDKTAQMEFKELCKKRDLLIRRTKLVRKLFRKNSNPSSMVLTVIPVLPPDLRPIVKMGNQIAASDLNRLYQRVIYRNDRLKKFLRDPATSQSYEMKYAQRLLQEAVDNLLQNGKSGPNSEKDARGRPLKSLSDILKGKQGRFRQFLLGKRVDYSGRSVIVVGPKLKLHECGLPLEMAKELYLPFLLKSILNKNYAKTVVGAKSLIKNNSSLAHELLREIMQVSPVLLNRAPTLHRLGIQAFVPRLIEGRAILLHPLVCSAFNADFDGDQMAVHVPITVEARAEAWKMMLSRNNILSTATGDPLAIPSQDMVLGCYYLTTFSNHGKVLRGSGMYFKNLMDVLNMYEQRLIDVHSLVWVKWYHLIENGTDQEDPLEIRISSVGQWQEITSNYHRIYDSPSMYSEHHLISQYVCTTPGRILLNLLIQKIIMQ